MAIFGPLYDKTLELSRHRHAPWYLSAVSFTESSFFPIPPDVMLAPMSMAQPKRWWFFALLTTVTSVLGGVLGYFIGAYGFELIEEFLRNSRYWPSYALAVEFFDKWGVLAIFIAGFSPIPYKVFTVAAGVMQMALIPFVLASLVGRGLRYFLVAGLMAWGGPRLEAGLRQHVERLGWATVVLAGLLILYVNVA